MSPKPLRWGIISTGGIATSFSKDLLTDPALRDASDVAHTITAVGSRSVESAQAFIDKLRAAQATSEPDSDPSWGAATLDACAAYGSYSEVYADPNVDVVYIGTPHTFHHRNAKDALLAGKHVLCEKPFTLSLEELDELVELARDKGLFLMEAVWTRFHPIAYAIQDVLFSGRLGKIRRFQADFSMFFNVDNQPDTHRMIDPALGGGSLLDMGPYPSVWTMLLLYLHPSNARTPPKLLTSYQTLYERSGVDLNSRWLLEFPGLDGSPQALLTTDMSTMGCGDMTVLVSCEHADLAIAWGPFRPDRFFIIPHRIPHSRPRPEGSLTEREEHVVPVKGNTGMAYEADEVYRCLARGESQSARMPWDESRIVQGWFDEVRNAGGTKLKGLRGSVGE